MGFGRVRGEWSSARWWGRAVGPGRGTARPTAQGIATAQLSGTLCYSKGLHHSLVSCTDLVWFSGSPAGHTSGLQRPGEAAATDPPLASHPSVFIAFNDAPPTGRTAENSLPCSSAAGAADATAVIRAPTAQAQELLLPGSSHGHCFLVRRRCHHTRSRRQCNRRQHNLLRPHNLQPCNCTAGCAAVCQPGGKGSRPAGRAGQQAQRGARQKKGLIWKAAL